MIRACHPPLFTPVAGTRAQMKTISSLLQTPKRRKLGVANTKMDGLIGSNGAIKCQTTLSGTEYLHKVLTSDAEKHMSGLEKDNEDESPGTGPSALTEEQKVRVEINKAKALAKRNLRRCEDHVAACSEKVPRFPILKELLIEETWLNILSDEFEKPYIEKLTKFVTQEACGKVPIYPPAPRIFHAFNSCPFEKVKVVIIGQDPYHGPGQAMGLCFSVPEGIKLPSSLLNIFKEIHQDVGCSIPSHGNLEKWVHQGVLLLNTVLTVREHHANSHAKRGWEPFTDAAIRAISEKRSGVVFLLWGNCAQEKIRLINRTEHHILKAAHPSGLSAHKGFFNCKHFSETNKILERAGMLPIDWQI